MKTLHFAVFLLIFSKVQISSQPGWNQLSSGTSAYLSALYFTDAQTGYIGGQSGYLAKTTNGGLNWQAQVSGATGFIREIEFLNSSTGYFVGDNGAIRKTTNGGLNWNALSPGYNGTIYGIAAVNNTVYISTFAGTVYKSTDAGTSWLMQTASSNSLLCIDFKSQDTGYSAGQGGVVYRTTNGGSLWTQYSSYTTANFWDMYFINNTTGWFAAYNGTIRNTNNSSLNYLTSQYGYNVNFESVYMINEMIGYISGLNGAIYKTIDGGLSWVQQPSGTTEDLQEMFFTDANTGYIVGGGGILLKTTDGGNQNYFVNLISPNGGEIMQTGSQYNIQWSSVNVGNVKIEYSTNSGSSWLLVQASVPAANNGYLWSVPNTPSSNCKVRVSDVSQPFAADISLSSFYIVSAIQGYRVPEIFYLKFNMGVNTTPNYAVPGYGLRDFNVSGHTIQNGGIFDSTLVGDGGTGSDHFVINNWSTGLLHTGWTIGFWISNISLGVNPANPVYLFGDIDGNNLRCYYGGSGGIGASDTGIMLRMNGATDVRIPVVKGQSYYIHIVYDGAGNINAYKNGQLSVTVPQPGGYTVVGNGPFKIGAHSTVASSLAAGMKLDEFRVYGRPLGASEIISTWNVTLPNNIVGINFVSSTVPERYELMQNYPNPFNPSTNIKFTLPISGFTSLKVFDVLGSEVQTLVNETLLAGMYETAFDGSNFSSGIYYYRIVINTPSTSSGREFTETKKMVLIK